MPFPVLHRLLPLTIPSRPKFTIALVRTPHLSAYHARFLVPLNFSKYDLRDYLYHAYNVKIYNIRSFVKQEPVRDTREQPRHWFRPDSKKYMTVEMEKPFVWPADPKSWEPWGKEEKEEQVKSMLRSLTHGQMMKDKRNEAAHLRKQAKEMLGWAEKKAMEEAEEGGEKREEAAEASPERKKSLLEIWEEKRTPQMLGR